MDPDLLKVIMGAGGLPGVAFYLLGIVAGSLYIKNSRNGHSNRSIVAKLDDATKALADLTAEISSFRSEQRVQFTELSGDLREAVTTAASDTQLAIKDLQITVIKGQKT